MVVNMNDYSEATMHLRSMGLRILLAKFDDWIRTGVDNHEIYSLEYIGEGSEYD